MAANTSPKKIALLSCDDAQYVALAGDDLLVSELTKNNNYLVETHSWNKKIDWAQFDAVIIRTTWDYMLHIQEFMQTLEFISQKTKLLNPFDIIRWNHHKFYLKELENQGVLIAPSVFFSFPGPVSIPNSWNSTHLIIKPAISAGSYKTLKLSRAEFETAEFKKELHQGDWILQPYLENITGGEISLIYFDEKFSHAILKVPKSGEFRVQEDFGGAVLPYAPSTELLELSQNILKKVDRSLLYARVDVIPYQDSYALMELELIEPSLYFKHDTHSPRKFKEALSNYI